jgi:hypothetical protein
LAVSFATSAVFPASRACLSMRCMVSSFFSMILILCQVSGCCCDGAIIHTFTARGKVVFEKAPWECGCCQSPTRYALLCSALHCVAVPCVALLLTGKTHREAHLRCATRYALQCDAVPLTTLRFRALDEKTHRRKLFAKFKPICFVLPFCTLRCLAMHCAAFDEKTHRKGHVMAYPICFTVRRPAVPCSAVICIAFEPKRLKKPA